MEKAAGLILGLICGLIFIAFTRRWGRIDERRIFAGGLIAAALIYLGFAAISNASGWIAIELIGLLIFSAIAQLGVKYSVLWLAAGWAAHTVWDTGLHLAGVGAIVAPAFYVFACISFDLLLAAYIVVMRERLSTSTLRRA